MGVVSNELKPSIPGKRSFRPSSSARQVNEWPISDVSSDLNIEVGAANFALHKRKLTWRARSAATSAFCYLRYFR
ncbi:hypothetical protein LguiA_020319 [Lonicera macranthoides]